MSGLLGRNEDDRGRETIRGSFLREVREKIVEVWDESHDVEVKWSNLKSALGDAAKVRLGYDDRRQQDWFRESAAQLRPAIDERN